MIFTVQVLAIDGKGQIKRHRNWGYYLKFKDAEEVIINNITDIYEAGYYNYGLVNEMPPGILVGHEKKEHWYKAEYSAEDIDKEGYIKLSANPVVTKCEKPIDKRSIIGLDW